MGNTFPIRMSDHLKVIRLRLGREFGETSDEELIRLILLVIEERKMRSVRKWASSLYANTLRGVIQEIKTPAEVAPAAPQKPKAETMLDRFPDE
jgi:hypothetical protein